MDFVVTVEGQEYDVTARDEEEAWVLANQYVEQRKGNRAALASKYRAEDAARDPTEGMGGIEKIRANLGAGYMDAWMGAKQLFGQASGEEYRDKRQRDEQLAKHTRGGRALQFAGATLPAVAATIPAVMAAPAGAATITGGAVLGGGTGLLAPTEDDDVVSGKAMNTGVGALTGGVLNKVLPIVSPYLREGARRGTDALRRLTEGGRKKIADTAFLREVGNAPQALRKILRARDIPGTLPTTAQQLGNRGMLETERRLSETGGEAALKLGQQRETSNAARNRFMQKELGADVPALEQAARDAHTQNMPQGFAQPFNRSPVLGELTRLMNNTNNTRAQAMLAEIRERVIAAMQSANPVEQLHQIRMVNIDDALSTLAQSDKKLAGMLRPALNSVKTALDIQLDRATNGAWTKYLAAYGEKAQAREQGKAGVELLRKMGQSQPDLAGNPMLTSQRQNLRREIGATDDAGRSLYGDAGDQTIKDVVESLDVEAQRLLTSPRGSPTAANLGRGASTADQLLEPVTGPGAARMARERAQQGLTTPLVGGTVGGAIGSVAGGGVGGTGGAAFGALIGNLIERGFKHFSQKNALDVARKLLDLYADPVQAVQVLDQAVRAGQLPPSIAKQIVDQISRAQALRAPGAAATLLYPDALRAQEGEPQ